MFRPSLGEFADPQVAWLHANGETRVLDGLSGAIAIDEQGKVLGVSNEAGHEGELALWSAGMLSYGGLSLPPPRPSYATPDPSEVFPFVEPLTGLYAEHRLVGLYAANEAGQLAAMACTDISGWCVALRLDPIPAVPEPSTAAAFLAGAAALCMAGRRRMRKG
ncbi:PEP-CTERM sorting domain-containing protein [Ideonella sp. BN130291]|uniref:PEP-CTERM sorting domain-containing protein n=1 Tax=Ideonella sp. BN130291 TaxID=3112940 RepID=UPI002E2710D4|nr:PEP-CTERM sorting domain-containing protein [Ideonella sp. BN130291]